jgi:hypothetical protein
LTYYNGIMWRIVLTADGTRVVQPFRLTDGELVTHPAKGT